MKTKKQKRRKQGVILLFAMLLLGGILSVGFGGWPEIRRLLHWAEQRHFERMGRQGPLTIREEGRWEAIHEAIWHRQVAMKRRDHWSRITVEILRLSPKAYLLQPWYGKPQRVEEILRSTQAIVAINGGVFDPKRRPLGLFKQKGLLVNRALHRRSIDGVFFLRKGEIGMERGLGFRHEDATWAFQSAPLLVADNQKVPLLRYADKVDRRSGLCIDQKGFLLLLATRSFFNGLTYREMADLMQRPEEMGGLGCRWGLNLDGGSSTQMSVRRPSLKGPSIRGMEPVPLFFLIFERSVKFPV